MQLSETTSSAMADSHRKIRCSIEKSLEEAGRLVHTKPTEKALRLAGVKLARFVPRLFRIDYLEEILANRLNLHIDESGNQDLSEGRYIVAVVLHDHSSDIATPINRYEERLAAADLPDVPFHGKDLLHGNERYSIVTPGDRKRLLAQFARFVRELPISFFTLQYDTSNVHNRNELEARIRRDLASLVFARLAFFQEFEMIAVYYDNGQSAVSIALHDALDYVLAKNVADYRDADPNARRLLQVADYICTIARASDAYDAGKPTKTHERFFGNRRSFKQSFEKQLDRKKFL